MIEIGCGTGLNFCLLEERIGPEGRLIGVDLADAMLSGHAHASRRADGATSSWSKSRASFRFPPEVDGILSSFALTLEPEFNRVVGEGARALKPGRRWVNSRPQAAIQLAAPSGAGADPLGQTISRLCGGGKAPPLGIPPATSEACDHAGAVFRRRLHHSRGGMIGSGGRPYGTTLGRRGRGRRRDRRRATTGSAFDGPLVRSGDSPARGGAVLRARRGTRSRGWVRARRRRRVPATRAFVRAPRRHGPRPAMARPGPARGRRTTCWPRSTAGSPRVSTPPILRTPGRCLRSWHERRRFGRLTFVQIARSPRRLRPIH